MKSVYMLFNLRSICETNTESSRSKGNFGAVNHFKKHFSPLTIKKD